MGIQRPLSRQPLPSKAQKVFEGRVFTVYQWEQILYDGSKTLFEKVARPDTAYVIPVTSAGNLILASQVQPGSTASYGLLGGRIEKGELPEEAAKRELLEEAGIVATKFELWDSFQFLPKLDWAIYIYIARPFEVVKEPSLDAGESINLVQFSFDGFVSLVAREEFGDLEVALRILRLAADPIEVAKTKRIFLG